MGASQSRPSSPLPSHHRSPSSHAHTRALDASPTSPDRPRSGSRLSSFGSFGRPTLRKRRTSSTHRRPDRSERERALTREHEREKGNGAQSVVPLTGTGTGTGRAGEIFERRRRESVERVISRESMASEAATAPSSPMSRPMSMPSPLPMAMPVPVSVGSIPIRVEPPRLPLPSMASSGWITPSLPTSPGPPILAGPSAEQTGFIDAHRASTTGQVVSPAQDIPTPPAPPASAPPLATSSASLPRPSRPAHVRGISLPGGSSPQSRSMTGRLTALLGFSAPGESPAVAPTPHAASQPISPPAAEPTEHSDSVDTSALAELTAELQRARAELEQSRRELEELDQEHARARSSARQQTPQSRGQGQAQAQAQAQQDQRVPVGAMLVIQGLAQTESGPTEEGQDAWASSGWGSGSSDAGTPGVSPTSPSTATAAGAESVRGPAPGQEQSAAQRPRALRRMSDGSLFRRRREQERERGASLDQQARMIGGLLTVAAAATANSLLQQQQAAAAPARSGVGGAIDALINRLRPNRSARHGIEQALGSYLRNIVRDNRRTSGHARVTLPPVGTDSAQPSEAHPEFEAFLRTLQSDLIDAVRNFAGSRGDDEETSSSAGTAATSARDPGAPVSPLAMMPPLEPIHSDESGEQRAERASHESAIPTFHHQLGQNLPTNAPDRNGVSGGEGQPRSLNFFRAHLFPPVVSTGAGEEEDPEAIVPCVFVGVRSIQHDPTMTTEELVHHPEFPFTQGTVPPTPPVPAPSSVPVSPLSPTSPVDYFGTNHSAPSENASPALPSTPTANALGARNAPSHAPPPAPTRSRSFRQRVLSRLSRPAPSERAMNTYLVYVIGGNYPRNHPVLRIPNLLTGSPLTDEELQLVSELLGPARPPTASKDEIAASGLRLVDGSEMRALGENGEVMDNCTERCLVCLGDYESGEECRVLQCRHGFHRECVDQWLEKGANSCPACRNQAVEKSGSAAGSTLAAASAATATEASGLVDPEMGVAAGIPNPLSAPRAPLALAPEREASGLAAGPGQDSGSSSPCIPVLSVPAGRLAEEGEGGVGRRVVGDDDVD